MTSSEDGIPVSVSSGMPRYEEGFLVFEEAARLEQNEQNPESLLYRANNLLVAEDGCYYVLDNGNTRIAVFDRDGSFLRSLGRQGSGPGEFQALIPLWAQSDVLAVFDDRLMRTTLLRTDGTLVSITSLPPGAAAPFQIHPLSQSGMLLYYYHQIQSTGSETHYWQETIFLAANGDTIGTVASSRIRIGKWFRHGNGVGYSRIVFGPMSQLIFHPERGILSYHSDLPELRWITPTGAVERIMQLELPVEHPTAEEIQAVGRLWDQRVRDAKGQTLESYYENSRRLLEFADPKAYWPGVVLDDNGFIWLMKHRDYLRDPATQHEWTLRLISPEGEYLGDAVWPVNTSRISRGHLLSVVENKDTGAVDFIMYRARSTIPGFLYR